MRKLIIALAVIVITGINAPRAAHAQAPNQVVRPQPPPPPQTPPPPKTVAPPMTFPFPPLMPPVAGGLLPRAGEGTPFRTFTPIHRGFGPGGSPFYGPLGYAYPDTSTTPRPRERTAAEAMGLLRLAVTPLSAQVFVDSLYVGTVADINAQNVLQLEAGTHRIEIRAPGYHTLTFDIRIVPYETVTYRGALEPERPTPPRAPAPAGSATRMYVIPNCYVGNIPPRQNRLPAGCDIKQVQVLEPR